MLALQGFTPLVARDLEFRRGDVNARGVVDISDSIAALEYLFVSTSTTACLDAADSNNSGLVDLTDPIFTLEYLFLGKAAPPSPGAAACGPDPDDDTLGCAEYPECG